MNMKQGCTIILTLEELVHPQPLTPIHCDNATAESIDNRTIKKQRSRSMEMRYFYVCDQVKHKKYDVRWHPGKEKLDNYTIQHHLALQHIHVRPIYL